MQKREGLVTLTAGVATMVLACFPVFVRLLDFVAIYGLVLMPIGAVVFAEHWLLPCAGLRRFWAERSRAFVNVPAVLAWALVLGVCFPFEDFTGGRVQSPMNRLGVGLFFRWLPGWFLAVGSYILFCYLVPAARPQPEEVALVESGAQLSYVGPGKLVPATVACGSADPPEPPASLSLGTWLAGGLALAALIACLLLPLKVFFGGTEPKVYQANMAWYKTWTLVATLAYFVGAVIWAGGRETSSPEA